MDLFCESMDSFHIMFTTHKSLIQKDSICIVIDESEL